MKILLIFYNFPHSIFFHKPFVFSQEGCTSLEACNFNFTAEIDDGSCLYPGDRCDDFNDFTMNDNYLDNCQCQGISLPIVGHKDLVDFDYNLEVTFGVSFFEISSFRSFSFFGEKLPERMDLLFS